MDGSLITESDNIHDELSIAPKRTRPRRVRLLFFTALLISLSVAGLLWFLSPAHKTSRENPKKLKSEWMRLYKARRFDKAAGGITRYLKIRPRDWRSREVLAEIYWQMGEGAKAFQQLSLVNTNTGGKTDRLYKLGLLAGQLGKEKEAVAYLARAAELSPKTLLIRTELAKALYRREQYDRAISEWKKAFDLLSPGDRYGAVIMAEIGDVFLAEGEKEQAKEAYLSGLAIEPGDPYLQSRLTAGDLNATEGPAR